MQKEAKIIRLKFEDQARSQISDNEVDILTSFQQELLKIDAIIPEYIKQDAKRTANNNIRRIRSGTNLVL